MPVLFFSIIALMRVVQAIANKKTSNLLNKPSTFFQYGAFYQMAAAGFSFLLLFFYGFHGFDTPTLICALLSALMFAADLFTALTAMKSASLLLCTMFAMGGLFIPCITGIFLFSEPMTLWQWIGLCAFIVSVYLLSTKPQSTGQTKKLSVKTLCLLLLNCLANGLLMVVQKYFGLLVPNGNTAMYSFLTFFLNGIILAVSMLFLTVFSKKDPEGNRLAKLEKLPTPLLTYGAALALSIVTINVLVVTMSKTVPSVVLFPVSSCITIMITTAIGFFIFKEKLSLKNIFGLILGIASIVIVNVL